jgi:two-component system cell cycle sensor histidine kinase/response regulator CckA
VETRRVAGAVRAVGMCFVVGILPALYLQWTNNWFKGFIILLATEIASLVALALNRHGKTEGAAVTLSWAGLICACSMVYFSREGYRDLALLLFPAMLATAALLLSRRPYILYAAFVVVSAATLIFLQIHGLNRFARQSGSYFDLLNVSIILALIAISLGLLSNAMRRSVADHRALIEQAGEGVIVLDSRRLIRMCNSSAAEILGVDGSGLLGRSFQDFVQSENPPMLAPVGATAQKVSFELTLTHADGSPRYVLATCTPRLSEEGRRDGVIAVLRDITKTRQADDQIRLLAHALHSTDSCVRISDISDRIIYVNPAFLHTYGYSESELLGQSIAIVRCARNAPEIERQIMATSHRDGWNGELWARSKEGREFPTALTCSVVRNERGEAIATVGVSRDLSQNKEVEGALAESRRRFQALLEQGHLVTLLLDKAGMVTFCNDTLLGLLGIPREGMIGRSVADLLAPDGGEEHIRDFEEALRLEKPHALKEYALVDSQGRRRWFQWSITPLRGADGTVTELACVGFEITEQRILREQYLQALKLDSIGRLAGGIAHDFNNLLTVINGYSSMLLDALPASDRTWGFAREIQDAGSHAASLTKQLLTFSRRQAIRPRPTDIGAVVAESQRMLQRVIGEDVRLVTTLDPESPRVMADPDQIRQVIMNLAVNARDAMPDGGKLEISTRTAEVAIGPRYRLQDRPPGEYVLLTVTDSGIGMDDETMQHLFEPFFTTKGQGKGTGLGMATVYGIVKQSGGWIDVVSRPGSGTTVNIYLPRTDAPAIREKAPAAALASAQGETVLIVEDQDTVRQLAARVLTQHGYSTMEAASGSEALLLLARLDAPAIDLLLTDVILPGINGRELADRVRSEMPEIKVLFMSGYAGDALGRRGVLEDGLAFLPKPFTPATLLHKVRNVLTSDG